MLFKCENRISCIDFSGCPRQHLHRRAVQQADPEPAPDAVAGGRRAQSRVVGRGGARPATEQALQVRHRQVLKVSILTIMYSYLVEVKAS